MKIDKYKIYEAGGVIGALGSSFVGGVYSPLTATTSVNWAGIPAKSILGVSKSAHVVADIAWEQIYTAGVFTAGNEWILTLEYSDSRQKGRKVFKESYVNGDDATSVCNRFRAQVASSSLPLTGSGTTTLILTAVAGAGVNYVATLGAVGTATFSAGAATADAQETISTRLAAKYDGVSAGDFANVTDEYATYIVKYLDHVASSDGEIGAIRNAAIFMEHAVDAAAAGGVRLSLEINGDYAAIAEADGVNAIGTV